MTDNTSATGGLLQYEALPYFVNNSGSQVIFEAPNGPLYFTSGGNAQYELPTEDQALDLFFQTIVAGVTGIPGNMVRPRWQYPEPPTLPSYSATWASVGVHDVNAEDYPWFDHFDNGTYAFDLMLRQEQLEILCSFYGPNAMSYACALRDGMYVSQNCETLMLAGMGLTQVGNPIRAPEYIKNQLFNRWDITLFIKRTVQRRYAILSLLKIAGVVNANTSAGGPVQAPFSTPVP
jgi:hypothetical protein